MTAIEMKALKPGDTIKDTGDSYRVLAIGQNTISAENIAIDKRLVIYYQDAKHYELG